jgi:hypothetical protein
MEKHHIKVLKTIKEFQEAINSVKETGKSIKVCHEYHVSEEELSLLDMTGVDVVMYEDYDEIIPI